MRRFAAALFAAVLFATGFAAAQGQDKPAAGDAAITQRVQSAIAKDTALKAMHIRVDTHDGVVSLTGFVRSMEDIAKAGALANAVRGVAGVRNGLRVANQPSRA